MKKVILIVVAALIVIGAGVALSLNDSKHPELKNPWGNKTTHELALTCLDQEYTVQHIHPQLTITINGQKQDIPESIGIESNCLHPLHTHDATGKIHVESPEPRDYTLADFFAVWGKAFDQTHILDKTADATHKIRMTVNGKDSPEYGSLVLKDLDDIQIYYEPSK